MNSKIDILIKQHCPNGVEKVKLGEVCTCITGGDTPEDCVKGQKEPSKEYPYPVYANGDETYGYASHYRIDKPAVTISSIGNVGTAYYREPYFIPVIRLKTFIPNDDSLNVKFLYFCLTVMDFIGTNSSLSSMKAADFKKKEIPLPPLAIQQEIVNILDKFTSLIDKIDEEINLRQKQYEYYREKLLKAPSDSPRGEWEWKKLGDCCKSIRSGKCAEKLEKGLYPVYGSTGIIAYTNNYVYGKEMVLIARVGANAGFVHIAKGKYDVTDNTLIIDLKENENLKFIYYTLINRGLNQYAKGGGQPLVTGRDIKELKFGFPSLSQQQTIVQTLDKFETLISQLKEERALRQKQYEYYREKLLTF